MNILIIGSGGHAGVVIDAIEKGGYYNIVGLIDDFAEVGLIKHGYQILGRREDIGNIYKSYGEPYLFIAVGDNKSREEIHSKNQGFSYPPIIHPSASVGKGVRIMLGSFVAAGAVINSNSEVQQFSIINTGASLDHDSVLCSYASLNPKSATGGRVVIGYRSTIGMGAMIRDGVRIGADCTIGMGAVVTDNIAEGVIAYGNPARIINKSTE